MRQELEIGGVTARGGDLSWCALTACSSTSLFSFTSSNTSFSASQIGAFLIDTLPIRNTSNSFDCIVGAQSNRHSSATVKLHQNAPDAVNLALRGNLIIPSGAEKKPTPREMLPAKTMGRQHDGSEGKNEERWFVLQVQSGRQSNGPKPWALSMTAAKAKRRGILRTRIRSSG
jgi:hypothetical protein